MDQEQTQIIEFLDELYVRYDCDYRDYAYTSIRRRIRHRMILEQCSDLSVFCNRALQDAKLREKLVSDFSLQVTSMFRDPTFFRAFRQLVVPWLKELSYIRIWHAGCATGEEVYSMAILLSEEGLLDKCRIYATDIHEQALHKARRGCVNVHTMQAYTRNYIQSGGCEEFSKYYKITGQEAYFQQELLSRVVFARHNLATDHSFHRFHVIICRNVMIYFNSKLRERVHKLFVESLGDQGFLALGRKESLLVSDHAANYITVDSNEKIYRVKEDLLW